MRNPCQRKERKETQVLAIFVQKRRDEASNPWLIVFRYTKETDRDDIRSLVLQGTSQLCSDPPYCTINSFHVICYAFSGLSSYKQ